VIVVSDPITTLLCCDSQFWLCIGEVNSIRVNGEPVEDVSFDMLEEDIVMVSYQMLGLKPATFDNDLEGKHDWRTCKIDEHTFTSSFLVALTASLFHRLTVPQLRHVLKILPAKDFPYCEVTGNACFVCETPEDLGDISMTTFECMRCSPSVTLDLSQGQWVLEHIGAHILYDSAVLRSMPLCGLCLRPSPMCEFFLTKGKGAQGNLQIDQKKSQGCQINTTYSYGVASESTKSLPCSNVPISCPKCKKKDPAVWQYFLKNHFEEKHLKFVGEFKDLWDLSNFEMLEMEKIWSKRSKVTVKRTKK
ncbi:hypothetical protein BJ912DRAFT_837309, partial [Pholiota molesta]